jgi:hypothetical protein
MYEKDSGFVSPNSHTALRLYSDTIGLGVGVVKNVCRIAVYPCSRLPV